MRGRWKDLKRWGQGGGLADVLLPVAALTIMGVVLFVVSTVLFRRQYR